MYFRFILSGKLKSVKFHDCVTNRKKNRWTGNKNTQEITNNLWYPYAVDNFVSEKFPFSGD